MLQPKTHRPHVGWGESRPHLDSAAVGRVLAVVWRDRWIGAGVASGIAAGAAAILALLMPRGPITTTEALTTMGAGLLVGVAGGFAMRSRWTMLVAPLAFVAVFELVRLGTDGPTVDGISFSLYGLMALVIGRGVHGVLVLLPMLVGAAVGAGIARRIEGRLLRHGWARVPLYA